MADEAVMDAVEVESGAEPVESSSEQAVEGTEHVEGAETTRETPDSPYSTKFSREMRTALKEWEAANPEAAKFAKQARENHARMYALAQLEPKGIDGVRERYALLDSLSRGEAKGPEAVTAMQEELAAIEEVDNLLAAGDPKAFDALGEDFNEGLAKLAPEYLNRIAKTDPDAFERAVLPHFISTLQNSPLVAEFNALVDVLNAKDDPRFDDKTKMSFAFQQLGKMGKWLNELAQKGSQLKSAPVADGKPDQIAQQRTELEKEQQKFHWDTKIAPQASAHENKAFETLFEPYQKRLKLDAAGKDDLLQAFKSGLNRAGSADKDYLRQMGLYRGQKNPDPAVVANYVKNAINKHSRPVMEALVKARYSPFLNAKPKTTVQAVKPGVKQGPVSPNVEIRTVKPPMSEIDHKNTPLEWLAKKQYRLYGGKVIQVRPVV